jgi:transcriptional regulator with XRE-family HTH domain
MRNENQLPNRIREHRKARGLRLSDLACAARCSIGQLSDLECGNRKLTLQWMRRLGRALGVDPGALLHIKDVGGLTRDEEEVLLRYRTGSVEQQWQMLTIARVINRAPL